MDKEKKEKEKKEKEKGVVGYYIRKEMERGKVLEADEGLTSVPEREEKVPPIDGAHDSPVEKEMVEKELKRAVTLSRDNGM